MKKCLLLLIMVTPLLIFSQQKVADEISALHQSGNEFEIASLFDLETNDSNEKLKETLPVRKGSILNINQKSLKSFNQKQLPTMSLLIPDPGSSEELVLELVEHQPLANDFKVFDSADPLNPVPYSKGVHYKGIIQGDPNSLVTISVFENEIMGVVTDDKGTRVIGRLENAKENEHIIYYDSDLPGNPFQCLVEDPESGEFQDPAILTHNSQATQNAEATTQKCVKVYIEVGNDIHNNKGGVSGATNYINGVMSQVITLYSNQGITMKVSEIKVWSSPQPFAKDLDSFTSYLNNLGNYNGDLAHFIHYSNGGRAWVPGNGFCVNKSYRSCISGISSSYNNVPTYSWTVSVVTHEMGHVLGSRHTHACVWNGNNTQIDDCGNVWAANNNRTPEGNACFNRSNPKIPSNGGTIMSYCHLGQGGINFNKGFHSQVLDRIKGFINNASCLEDCGGTPPPPGGGGYCESKGNSRYEWIQSVATDGFSNVSGNNGGYGDFTSKTITLVKGKYIQFTLTPGFSGSTSYNEHWKMWIDYNRDGDFDDGNEQVGSTSGTGTVSSTMAVPNIVSAGTTRMRISMKYNSTPPSSCGDIGDGEVEDYTVLIQEAAPPPVTYCDSKGLNTNYEWINRVFLREINNTSGNNQGYADFTSMVANLVKGTQYKIETYPGTANGSVINEYWQLWIDYNRDGVFSSSESIGRANSTGGIGFYFTPPTSAVSGNTRMRISMSYDGTPNPCGDIRYGEVEDYTVNLTSPGPALVKNMDNNVKVYPNPANELLNIDYSGGINSVEIVSTNGRIVRVIRNKSDIRQINTTGLAPGIYLLKINTENGIVRKKFVVAR